MSFQKTLKALSDPNRRKILDILKDGRMSAGEIGTRFSLSGATLSHHLSVLKDAELIQDEKKGKYIYYEINMTVLDEILNWLNRLRG